MALPASPFFYPILDSQFSRNLQRDAEATIAAGAKILQIRAKNLSRKTVYEIVEQLMPRCESQGVCLIVNDFVDIAMVVRNCGVHLGQQDFPIREARSLLPAAILGLSTHSADQVILANELPADYIAIGPMFHTATKVTENETIGFERLGDFRKLTGKPLVAIGGIKHEHVDALIRAGVDGIAVISELYRSSSLSDSVELFLRKTHK